MTLTAVAYITPAAFSLSVRILFLLSRERASEGRRDWTDGKARTGDGALGRWSQASSLHGESLQSCCTVAVCLATYVCRYYGGWDVCRL